MFHIVRIIAFPGTVGVCFALTREEDDRTRVGGAFRRLKLQDVTEYRERRDREAREALAMLAREAQEAGDYFG